MTELDENEHQAQMADMKSFDEPMPSVGIFWYDPEDHSLFGVRKKELTPREVEEAAEKGKPFINYPHLPCAGQALRDEVQRGLHANTPWPCCLDHQQVHRAGRPLGRANPRGADHFDRAGVCTSVFRVCIRRALGSWSRLVGRHAYKQMIGLFGMFLREANLTQI